MAKTISSYDVLINFVSLITFMLDIGTDILVVVQLFEGGHVVWGGLTAAFVGVPTVLIQIFSLKWHITDRTLTVANCLPHLFLFAPVQRYLRVIRLGLKARSTRSFNDIDRVYREQNDVCILRLMESFMEAAPQLCLQLYIILMSNTITVLTGISTASSLISLAWALTAYSDGLRLAYRDLYQRRWGGLLAHWLWQSCMTAARVMALVAFASVFQFWVFVGVGIHWVSMTVWISIRGTDFGEGPCERAMFLIVAGFIYIFCFLNLQEGRSRWRMLAYYLVVLGENTALLVAWFLYKDAVMPIMDIATPTIVLGGFLLGVVCLLVYYRLLHPGGPVYLYTVKNVAHPAVLNNQLRERPSVFDASNTTQMSVLGSDVIELSHDLDHSKLSVNRMSNRSSASYSQQHLQLLWALGLPGCSSSSDSSLDMLDVGSRHGRTRTGTSSRSASSTRQLLQGSRSSSVSDGRLYTDQPDRRDQVHTSNSTHSYQRHIPQDKMFTQKDIYGFHEDRFRGTYHSPLRKSCESLGIQPPCLSPLNATKLWEDTAGRLRSPLVGTEDDTLSSLDVSELMERSYGRGHMSFSWVSSRTSWSTSSSIRPGQDPTHVRIPSTGRNSTNHGEHPECGRSANRSGPHTSEHLSEYNCHGASSPEMMDSHESGCVAEDHTYCRNTDTAYEDLYEASIGTLGRSRSSCDEDFDSFHSPRAVVHDNRSHRSGSPISDEESGVFPNISNRSGSKSLHNKDPSIELPLVAVTPQARCGPPFEHTQSVPVVTRRARKTLPLGVPVAGKTLYENSEDIHAACNMLFPDTPWRLDYLNLEPAQTDLDYQPPVAAERTNDYLHHLKRSMKSDVQPSPLKVQEFQNSPSRLGRNIDLFNIHSRKPVDLRSSAMSRIVERSRKSLTPDDSFGRQKPSPGQCDSGYHHSPSSTGATTRGEGSPPFGMYRHSSKMSQIRGTQAGCAPVRGSPMPVKHRVRSGADHRRSREVVSGQARGSRYQKQRTGDLLKDNMMPNRTPCLSSDRPNADHRQAGCQTAGSSHCPESSIYARLDSYRRAIDNSTTLAPADINDPELRKEDFIGSDSQGEVRKEQICPTRQPFQSLQNTPGISPIGNTKKNEKQPAVFRSVTSSTPKLHSGIQALIDAYTSPDTVSAAEPVVGVSKHRPYGRKEVRSRDYLR